MLRCRPGNRRTDNVRTALVFDYRGDQPPLALFNELRAAGWVTPAPVAPPADALDWSRPDRVNDRRWTVRPYLVEGAVAVPDPRSTGPDVTREWLQATLAGLGVELEPEAVPVISLLDANPGRAEVLHEDEIVLDDADDDAIDVRVPGLRVREAKVLTPAPAADTNHPLVWGNASGW
jgi:hypothetical protein